MTGHPMPMMNFKAQGLFMTDTEYAGVMKWLGAQEAFISRAWIWGSRRSGVRRIKDDVAPPDIDLAVEIAADLPGGGEPELARHQLRHSLREFAYEHPEARLSAEEGKPGFVQLEFHEPGSNVTRWMEEHGATLVWPRPG